MNKILKRVAIGIFAVKIKTVCAQVLLSKYEKKTWNQVKVKSGTLLFSVILQCKQYNILIYRVFPKKHEYCTVKNSLLSSDQKS